MLIKFPEIHFSLPEWEYKRDFSIYADVTKSLKEKTKSVGFQSMAFFNSSFAIFSLAKEGGVSEIPSLIKKPVDVRALTKLWLPEDQLGDDFFTICPVTKELLAALYNPRPILSKLVTQQLLRLFFNRFDEVGDLDALILCLHAELSRNARKLNKSDLAKLTKNRKKIISLDGPAWIAKQAIKKQTDLDNFIDEIGLNSFINTRFYSLCQNHYYLEQLRSIEPGVKHAILEEIVKPAVYESPYNQTEMLGHEILRILIDRSPKEGVDEQWQGIILTIAGDPRISKTAPKYQLWWTALNTEQIQKVRGWLSRFDLLLFLKVLEDYGEMSGKEDMNRMFPARKKFLEGLFDLGLVEDSRLFINYNAEYYLKKNYKAAELPVYANVKDPSRSMIYLKVAGKHMIEGTHNFKFWLYEDLPIGNRINDYNQMNFTPKELTTQLESYFFKEFRGLNKKSPISISHCNDWQHKAIDAFDMYGIQVNPEKVLTEQNYLIYKRRYGLSSNNKIKSSFSTKPKKTIAEKNKTRIGDMKDKDKELMRSFISGSYSKEE